MQDRPSHLDAVWAKVAALRGAALHVWSGARAAPPPENWPWWDHPRVRTALTALLVAGGYYVGTLIGLSVMFQLSPISPIWPPNTILLVALLLVPLRRWWACLLAVCGAHMLVALPYGVPLVTATGLYLTNSAEAVLGAFLIRRFIGGAPWLGSLRRVAIYVACAVVVAPVLTSFPDAAVVVATGLGKGYWLNWTTRCVSNSLAELTIGPALLLALTEGRGWMRAATRWRLAEAALLALGLLLVSAVVFGGQITTPDRDATAWYAVLPVLLWAAVRFGVGGTSAALLGITVLATVNAAHGRGPFSEATPADTVIALELFLIGISVPMLLLAALIQEREQTKSALKASEARYRDLVESQTELVCRYLPDSTLTFVNEAYCRWFGKTREQLIGTKFVDSMDHQARDHHMQYTAAMVAHPHTSVDEHEVMLPDGAVGWQQWTDHAIYDASGVVVEFQAIGRDVTERKRAEEALRASEERYRAVVNNFPRGAVLLFGQDMRHIFADGQGLPELAVSKEAIVGNTLWDAFPAELAAAIAPHYRAALAGAHALLDVTHASHTYQAHVLPIQYANGTVGMALLQDVTEQRRAEMLAELDRAKTAFFSTVSHEFRTPLTLLLGPTHDALVDREAPLPPRQRERLELIQRGGLHLRKLVNTLLDFSRIEAGRVQAAYEPTDVGTLTAELASTFRLAVERAGLRLEVECEPLADLPQPVLVDRDMWETIVLNLLSNALKFTLAGTISVSVCAPGSQGDWIELQVADTGTGIPAEELPRLFERYYRAHGAQARTQEGTGIGLAVVQDLVRLHGGTVRVTSTVGVGSTFTVSIPTGDAHLPIDRIISRAPATEGGDRAVVASGATQYAEEALRWLPEPARAQLPADETQAHPGTATVLVADDNADMRTYLAHLLSEHWEVQTVGDGAAALAAATARLPDLILADVMMPGLDGFALVAALRDNPQTQALPVILLSARAGEEATVEGLRAGADDYLVKPFSGRELVARVQTHLKLARARREATERAAQLDAIFEAMSDGVLVHDFEGRTLRANQAYRDLLRRYLAIQGHHVEPETVLAVLEERERVFTISDELGRVLPQREWPTERALRGETLTGAHAIDEFTRGADGSALQVSVAAAPVRTASGAIMGAVGVFRDVTERRQLERQVAEQASQLEAIFDAITDGVFVLDARGSMTRLNPAGRQLFGLVPDAELARTAEERAQALDLRDIDCQPFAADQLPTKRLLRGEVLAGTTAQTLTMCAHSGAVRTVSLTGAPLRDAESGRIIGAVGVLRDISELKRTQAALAEQERSFRTLVENSPDIITRFDRNLRHLYVSPAAEAPLGIPVQARLGKTYAEIGLPEAAYAPWEHALRRVFATGQPHTFDTGYYAPGRPPRVSQVRYVPEFAADGSVESVLGITTDVTELKQAEEALRRQEQLYRTLVENSPDIIARFDRSLRYLYINPAISHFARMSPEQYLGKTNQDLGWPESYYREAHLAIEEVFRTGQSRTVVEEVSAVPGSQESRYFRAQFLPEFGEDRRVESVLTVTSEITDLKRAEEALREAKATAEAAQREEERRRHEAERREKIAESLRDVLTILNSDRQATKILDFITKQAGRLLNSDAAAIYMAESDVAQGRARERRATSAAGTAPESLVLRALFGLPLLGNSTRGKHRLTVGDAAVRRAMVARQPVAVLAPHSAATERSRPTGQRREALASETAVVHTAGDAEASPEYLVVREEPLPAPYRALLAIPIIAQGEVYGGLLLLYTAPRRFSADEVALAMAYGDQIALAVANARLQEHIEQAAIETERNRLARELHDTVTQEIFTASVLAESIPWVWETHRTEAEAKLRQLHQLTRGALAALRALLLELRPAVLEQQPLADLLRHVAEAMTTRSGVPVELAVEDGGTPMPNAVKIVFYRIAQEALMNAAKHAQARTIAVHLRYLPVGETFQLEVHDDGQGFETGAPPGGHFGIGMMRERARTVGALLRITSRREQGTRVTVRWARSAHTTTPGQEHVMADRAGHGRRG